MASAGPNSGATFVNDDTIGGAGLTWVNPSRAASSDNLDATMSAFVGVPDEESNALKATNFGFSIPAGATIDGITVAIERQASLADQVNDGMVRLVKADVYAGDNKASATLWPAPDTVATYGGAADLWGTTWDVDDINSATFGVGISARETTEFTAQARIDHITITVDYTEAAAGAPAQQRVSLGLGLGL